MRNRLLALIAALLLIAAIGSKILPLYQQEGNPMPFLMAAMRLSGNESQVVPISGSSVRYLVPAKSGLNPFIDLMASQGWQYQEQMGAGIIFYRDGIGMTALSRMYSRFFMVIELPPLNQEPYPADSTCVTLTATGDILMHNTIIASGLNNNNYDFRNLYSPVKHLLDAADYASVNLESALAGPASGYTGYPLFNSPDNIAQSLKESGFDLVVTANNHILDRGYSGALRTMDVLRQAGLDTTGTFKSKEEKESYLIKDIRGIKVGYLAYSYGTNGLPIPAGKEYFYNYLQKDRVLSDIKALRPQVDVLVLVLHWGVEYSPSPTTEQRELARSFFEKGADIILGSHPHVLQPLEIMHINGKEKLVFYSMGNSMGDQNGMERNSGVIVSLQFTKNNNTGETYLSSYSYIPTYIHEYYDQGRLRFRLLAVEEAINAIKSGQDPYLGSDKLPMLEQLWSEIDYQITRPLP